MKISQVLKDKRTEQQLTQEQLAEKIFVSKKTISNWETGKTTPDLESLILLSEVFAISLDELIKGDQEMVKRMDEKIKKGGFFPIVRFLIAGLVVLSVIYHLFPNDVSASFLFFGYLLIIFVIAVLFIVSGLIYFKNWFHDTNKGQDK